LQIAAILFDLYETLVTERHAPSARASSLGKRLGLDDKAFRMAWKPQRLRVIRGEESFPSALLRIGLALGHSVDPDLAHVIADERRREKAALFRRFDPAALEVLWQLRARGLKLGVISNCFREDVHAWPQCQAAEYFDTAVFSFEVGRAKPDPEIYLEAMHRLGVEAANTAFIGDGGDDELPGAERLGLRTAQATWFRDELPGLPGRIPRLASWSEVLDFARSS
jgi:putative hydrolase of the HAD superfamily